MVVVEEEEEERAERGRGKKWKVRKFKWKERRGFNFGENTCLGYTIGFFLKNLRFFYGIIMMLAFVFDFLRFYVSEFEKIGTREYNFELGGGDISSHCEIHDKEKQPENVVSGICLVNVFMLVCMKVMLCGNTYGDLESKCTYNMRTKPWTLFFLIPLILEGKKAKAAKLKSRLLETYNVLLVISPRQRRLDITDPWDAELLHLDG